MSKVSLPTIFLKHLGNKKRKATLQISEKTLDEDNFQITAGFIQWATRYESPYCMISLACLDQNGLLWLVAALQILNLWFIDFSHQLPHKNLYQEMPGMVPGTFWLQHWYTLAELRPNPQSRLMDSTHRYIWKVLNWNPLEAHLSYC